MDGRHFLHEHRPWVVGAHPSGSREPDRPLPPGARRPPHARALGRLDFALRKCGHISEYTILGALLFRALANPSIRTSRATAQLAIGIAIVYASSDEFHQLFVPSREAAIRDVLYDTLGATIGVTLTTLLHRRRRAPR